MTEIHHLVEGYRRFHEKYFTSDDRLYRELATSGQSPKTLVIACSDSRVDPSIITSAEPGDIFVVRNVANLVPPYEKGDQGQHGVSAALEFAVGVLEVQHIIILGHSNCAGIQTLLKNGIRGTDFIGRWMDIARPAKERAMHQHPNGTGQEIQHACEKEAIHLSLGNLMTFPWIKKKVEAGSLQLHGWYFSLNDGILEQYNQQSESFKAL